MIMDGFIEAKLEDLPILNNCRIYLQVSSLADITTFDGTTITDKAWHGVKDTTIPPLYSYRDQKPPSASCWHLWQRALTTAFHLSPRRKLPTPLRYWIDSDDTWTWFYSPSQQQLFHREDDGTWSSHCQTRGRQTRQPKFTTQSEPAGPLPPDKERAVVDTSSGRYLTCVGHQRVRPPQPPQFLTLRDYIASLPPSDQWVFAHFQCDDDGEYIAQSLREGSCRAVGDGSFKEDFATASFVIEGPTAMNRFRGDVLAPGDPSCMEAFRGELAGIYATAKVVETIMTYHRVETGEIKFGCDCTSALYRCFVDKNPHDPSMPHADLITATKRLLHKTTVRWTHRHVETHQDEVQGKELSYWERLNCEMDSCNNGR